MQRVSFVHKTCPIEREADIILPNSDPSLCLQILLQKAILSFLHFQRGALSFWNNNSSTKDCSYNEELFGLIPHISNLPQPVLELMSMTSPCFAVLELFAKLMASFNHLFFYPFKFFLLFPLASIEDIRFFKCLQIEALG